MFATQSSKIRDLLSLIRPANSIMVGFAVIVGIAVTSDSYVQIFSLRALLGFLTGFFISSFSMVSNDIYDIQVDRVNQPGRPLSRGSVSVPFAKTYALLLLTMGLVVSLPLSIANFAIATAFGFVGWYYNYDGKRHGLLGNSLVALSLAIPYIYGSIVVGNYTINLGYLLALTSFLAGIGREVLKGIIDVSGDRLRNIKSVAISFGANSAKKVAGAFFLLAVASSALPLLFDLLGNSAGIYIVLITIPDAIFIFLTYKVLRLSQEKEVLKLKTIALIGMMLGLIAYLVSGFLA